MKNLNLKKFVGVSAATVLTLGLTAGVTGVASAAKHDPGTSTTVAQQKMSFQGTISSVAAATTTPTALPEMVTVTNAAGTVKTFSVITGTTKVLRSGNAKHPVALLPGERVVVISLTSTPTIAKSINVLAIGRTVAFQGTITGTTPADTSVTPPVFETVTVLNLAGTSKTFTFTSTTKVLHSGNAKHPVTLLTGERVVVRTLASVPTAVVSINVVAAK